MMMTDMFTNANNNALEDDDDDNAADEDNCAIQTATLAQELMNMMSEKENSSSVNIISHKDAIAKGLAKQPVVKYEHEDVDCEVILYVDNREKKNQQQGNYIYNKLIESSVNCEQKTLPLGDFIWILRVKQKMKPEEAIE